MRHKTANRTLASRFTFRPQFEALEDRCVPATIVVNNPGDFVDADPATMTLREATEVARSDREDDVITFNMSGNTIHLKSELVVGGFEFNGGQTGTTTIEGQGIVLDAGGQSRVMRIEAGTVHVKGMTIQNGNADIGGGILALDGTLARPTVVILENCTVANNAARSTGGGIFTAGAVHLIDTEVSGNSARQDGGGVAVYGGTGSLTAIDAVFSQNVAGRNGGAIHNGGGTVSVSSSTFSSNHARKGNDISIALGSLFSVDDDSGVDIFRETASSKGGRPK